MTMPCGRILSFLISCIFAFVLTFSVSCQRREQSPGNPASTPSGAGNTDTNGSTPTGPIKSPGTADSGGGNTLLGKPLESYQTKIQDLESYKKFLAPIIESEKIKGRRIAQGIATILNKKTWYMIPSELEKLSAEQIGAAVGGEQAALQDFKQVWINSLIFDKMNLKDQATLILHEIFMGLRLLNLDSSRASCLAYETEFSKKADPEFCFNNGKETVRGKPSDLTKEDYAQIRAATAQVIETEGTLDEDGWDGILAANGFISTSTTKTISLKDLSELIESSRLMKTWPRYGFDLGRIFTENQALLTTPEKLEGMKLTSDTTCEFDIKIENENFELLLMENGTTNSYSSRWNSEITMHLQPDIITRFHLFNVSAPKLQLTPDPKKGDVIVNFTLKFIGKFLMGAEIRKLTCINDDCSNYGQGIDGYFVACATQNTGEFPKQEKK